MRAFVILNEKGGTVLPEGAEARKTGLVDIFRRHGVEATVEIAPGEAIADRIRRAVDEGGYDAIVAGGGDGTISAAANVLSGTDVPLGILPLGTLNHFAKDLRLPLELEPAVAAIARGMPRRVDVAEVNGRVFINNSSVGIYPYAVTERERHRGRSGLGKWTAMALAAFRAFRRFPRRRLIVFDETGAVARGRTPCVFVGNNTYGISLFNPGAREALDRGELCLYVMKHRSRWGALALALRAALGRIEEARDFERRCGLGQATIGSRASRLPVSLDGEVAVMRPPLRYRVRPGALRVLGAPA
jgi:diacylglycerol kinase family enzyme